MSNLDASAHQTLAEDASRDTAENEADLNEDQPNQSGASFTVLERSLEEVQPRKKGRRSIEADKSPHIEARDEMKKRKKGHGNPPATDGDAENNLQVVMAEVRAQSAELVSVAKKMEENSKKQTKILE